MKEEFEKREIIFNGKKIKVDWNLTKNKRTFHTTQGKFYNDLTHGCIGNEEILCVLEDLKKLAKKFDLGDRTEDQRENHTVYGFLCEWAVLKWLYNHRVISKRQHDEILENWKYKILNGKAEKFDIEYTKYFRFDDDDVKSMGIPVKLEVKSIFPHGSKKNIGFVHFWPGTEEPDFTMLVYVYVEYTEQQSDSIVKYIENGCDFAARPYAFIPRKHWNKEVKEFKLVHPESEWFWTTAEKLEVFLWDYKNDPLCAELG
jgi:hypothetical protein